MSWFKKLMPSRIRTEGGNKRTVPEGLWTKCADCDAVLYRPELERNLNVCPKCDHHMPLGARERLEAFLDSGRKREIGRRLEPNDVLRFKDHKRYKDRIAQAQKAVGEKDALVALRGRLFGHPIIACAFEFRFMGGSMGSVVGERFTLAAERCLKFGMPLICFTASGGARMQEALFSLMQMAKTSAALARMAKAGLPFVSVLTHPTTGGVSASLGMLGDVNLAEPRALIGFAGPRVIEQTVRETLPEGFQRSEFLVEHGAVDMIVDRRDMRHRIAALLGMFMNVDPADMDLRGAAAEASRRAEESLADPDVSAPGRKDTEKDNDQEAKRREGGEPRMKTESDRGSDKPSNQDTPAGVNPDARDGRSAQATSGDLSDELAPGPQTPGRSKQAEHGDSDEKPDRRVDGDRERDS